MRLATVSIDGDRHAAVVVGESVGLTDLADGRTAIAATADRPDELHDRVVRTVPLSEVEVLAPVPRPGKIFGSGINYRSHKDENPNAQMPVEPGFFSKFPSSVIGPGVPIRIPSEESEVDYEVELAIVIGRPGRDIAPADAARHVYGYTVVNDVSGRDVQFRANQMDLGKGFDTFCPMGPWVVTADEVGDLEHRHVRSYVNGELRQDATPSEWVWTMPELVAHASRHLTLEPGDVITTGTPAGCGTFRSPPLWLRPGDDVVVEVDGVGRLANPVVAGW